MDLIPVSSAAAQPVAEPADDQGPATMRQLTAGTTLQELGSRQQQLATAVLHETLKLFPVAPDVVTSIQGPVVEMHKVNDAAVDVKVTLGFQAQFSNQLQETAMQVQNTGRHSQQGSGFTAQASGLAGGWSLPLLAASSCPGGPRSPPVIIEQHESDTEGLPSVQPAHVSQPTGAQDIAGDAEAALLPATKADVVLQPQSPFAAMRDQPWSLSVGNGPASLLAGGYQLQSAEQQQQQHQHQQQQHSDEVMEELCGVGQVPLQLVLQGPVGAAMHKLVQEQPNAASLAVVPYAPLLDNSQWLLDSTRLKLGKRIAVGGFAEVFAAQYEGTPVAAKRLYATDSDTVSNFIHEVRTLAQLRHPNLILWMGYTLQPEPCIVTEFMARGSLFHLLRSRRAAGLAPDPRLAAAVATSVARGMAYLHSRKPPILHLDLKSPNILIDEKWRIKIADFGLSTVKQHSYVSSGHGSGTPEWSAPEVLRCERFNERADVYSYGVVLWELLTGQTPWEGLSAMQVVGAVGYAGKSLPEPTDGDPVLRRLCSSCLSVAPAARPSFAAIVQMLDETYGSCSKGLGSSSAGGDGPLMLEDGRTPGDAGSNGSGAPRMLALPPPPQRPALPAPDSCEGTPASGQHQHRSSSSNQPLQLARNDVVQPLQPQLHQQQQQHEEQQQTQWEQAQQQQQQRQQSKQQASQQRHHQQQQASQQWQQPLRQAQDHHAMANDAPVPHVAHRLLPLATPPARASSQQFAGRGCTDSPASRRRDRSPCSRVSSDDPPPVVARRADGGKAPSPRQAVHLWLEMCPELHVVGGEGRSRLGSAGSPGAGSSWGRASMSGVVSAGSLNLPSTSGVPGLPTRLRHHRRTGSGSTLICQSSARAAAILAPCASTGSPLLPVLVHEQADAELCSPLSAAIPEGLTSHRGCTPCIDVHSSDVAVLAWQPLHELSTGEHATESPWHKGHAADHPCGDDASCAGDCDGADSMDYAYHGTSDEAAPQRSFPAAPQQSAGAGKFQANMAAVPGAGEGVWGTEVVPCSFSQWGVHQSASTGLPHPLAHASMSPLGRAAALGIMRSEQQLGCAQPLSGEHAMAVPMQDAGRSGFMAECAVAQQQLLQGRAGLSQPRNVPQPQLAHASAEPDSSDSPASLSAWHPESNRPPQQHHAPDSMQVPGSCSGGGVWHACMPAEDCWRAQHTGVPWVGRPLPTVSCQSSRHAGRGRWFESEQAERGSSGGSTPASLSHWQLSPQTQQAQLQQWGSSRGSSHHDLSLPTGMEVCRPLSHLSPFATASKQQGCMAVSRARRPSPSDNIFGPELAASTMAGVEHTIHTSAAEFSLLPPCASATSPVHTHVAEVLWPPQAAARLPYGSSCSPFQSSASHDGGSLLGPGGRGADDCGRCASHAAGCSSAASWGMDAGAEDDDDRVVSSPPSPDMTAITAALSPELQHLMQQAIAGNNYRWGRFKVTDFKLPCQAYAGAAAGAGAIAAAAGAGIGGGRSSGSTGCQTHNPVTERSDADADLLATTVAAPVGGSARTSADGSGEGRGDASGLVRSRSTTTMYRKGRFFVSRTTTQQLVDEASSDNGDDAEEETRPQEDPIGSSCVDTASWEASHVVRAASTPVSSTTADRRCPSLQRQLIEKQATCTGLPPLPPSASPRVSGQTKERGMRRLAFEQLQQQQQHPQVQPVGQQQQQQSGHEAQPPDRAAWCQPRERHYHAGRFNVHEVQSAVKVEGCGSAGLASAASTPSSGIPEACLCPERQRRCSETQPCTGSMAASGAAPACSYPVPVQAEGVQPLVPGQPKPAASCVASIAQAMPPLSAPHTPGTRVGRFLIVDVPGAVPLAAGGSSTPSSEATASPASGIRARSEGGSGVPTPTGTGKATDKAVDTAAMSPAKLAPALHVAASPGMPHVTSRGRFKVWEA